MAHATVNNMMSVAGVLARWLVDFTVPLHLGQASIHPVREVHLMIPRESSSSMGKEELKEDLAQIQPASQDLSKRRGRLEALKKRIPCRSLTCKFM